MVAAGKDTARGIDAGAAVGGKRRQLDTEQSIAGLSLDRSFRPGLLRQRFAEQAQEYAESMRVEIAELGKPHRLSGGQA